MAKSTKNTICGIKKKIFKKCEKKKILKSNKLH